MAIQAQLYSDNNNIGFGFGAPLCGSQDYLMMDNVNGCCGVGVNDGFNQFLFSAQQTQQQQHQQKQQQHMQQQQQLQNHQQQKNQSLCFDNTSGESYNLSMLMPLYQSIALQVEKQRQEFDQYIRQQNERLRLVLQEQRKQQLGALLKKIELNTKALLRQKDEEIAKATSRTMELEMLVKKFEMEGQAWQRIAQEHEAMVFSLNNTLEQLKEKASCFFFNNGAEDAESCCDIDEEQEVETEQNRATSIGFGDNNNNHNNSKAEAAAEEEQRTRKMMLMACKGCNCRDSCVLFLPCRHLCSCKACEAFLDSCPVCLTPKKACIEALIN